MGIPTYGKSVLLKNPHANGQGAAITGIGMAGPITQTAGFLGFNEVNFHLRPLFSPLKKCLLYTFFFFKICSGMNSTNGWRTYLLSENAEKYTYKGIQWISYDDPDTVKQKVKFTPFFGFLLFLLIFYPFPLKAKYVVQNGLGGVMFWSIDTDDFLGECYSQPYPLLAAANKALGNSL